MKPNLPNRSSELRINILLFEAFSNMVLACLLEPLRVVRDEQGAAITWTILTPHDGPVRSSSGLSLSPDRPLSNAEACNLLIIVGGDRFRSEAENTKTRTALALARRAQTVIAADTGPWLLAAAGYLDGRCAALHWQLLDEFTETFSEVQTVRAPFALDGKWLTCGSAAGAMELVLREISRRFGEATRFTAASMFLNAPRVAGEEDRVFGDLPTHPNPRVRRVLNLMAGSIEAPRTLVEIAREAGLTLRTMARLFETELNLSPGRCYQHMRLARARELMMQQGISAADAAPLCGFSCAASLKRALAG
ncbi:helix-turn-helix domain-containing protein [Loktanella sp. IMCC34160]|uniref:GlxA family transcriptional regulator n=1 Tax=Loktanella sp. IMCC34160 TaxID=2510646 RepID=UPI00101C19AB|nr:DJ-1/PfpI family protein [Loktanella sp. IMCC34160]RYG89444.1 helix-turn-helix domain-containing protein [Loktanella sp. IMCC34160]